jgi:hypothetical protein
MKEPEPLFRLFSDPSIHRSSCMTGLFKRSFHSCFRRRHSGTFPGLDPHGRDERVRGSRVTQFPGPPPLGSGFVRAGPECGGPRPVFFRIGNAASAGDGIRNSGRGGRPGRRRSGWTGFVRVIRKVRRPRAFESRRRVRRRPPAAGRSAISGSADEGGPEKAKNSRDRHRPAAQFTGLSFLLIVN